MKAQMVFVPYLIFVTITAWARPLPTQLFSRGYSVIPAPQKVNLQPVDIDFDGSWVYDSGPVGASHIAARTLVNDLKEFHSIELTPAGLRLRAKKSIRLSVVPGTVQTGADAENDKQAYRLKIAPGLIEITGNGHPGLFYGVQTLLQLLKQGPRANLLLPVGTIEDWPTYQLRFLHWDTKHHQDRMETLKRYLDWSARFKINMIGFELEDKFEYPSRPVIAAPGAFTTGELQEIVNYGLERYIQVVPQVQAPAHLAYVLKHAEFADLRSDGNNYQGCLCDERTYDLIFSMYDDLIKATQGVNYFFVSTDEVYYAGICAKCDKPYNPENRSLKWVEFAQRAHEFLARRGRKMLAWVEYPLLTEHIGLLPADIINGVLGGDLDKIKAENKRGIRQLVYVSMQGSELLFPDYLALESKHGLSQGHLVSAFNTFAFSAQQANPLGVYGAAWDDSGLHNETFWLGWATVAQYGWTLAAPSVEQTAAEFMNIYYGPQVTDMVEVYRGLQAQARFFERSWERVVSNVRGPGYGNSYGKGSGTTRYDYTLPPPALPALPNLYFTRVYAGEYGRLADEAHRMAVDNDVLTYRIQQNVLKATRNRYNLEVFLSLAELTGHHDRMILGMKGIEDILQSAREALEKNNSERAVGQLIAAYDQAQHMLEERRSAFQYLKSIWERSRFPKGQEVNGKKFTHVLDDTKDHWADRRLDLSYMIAPEESIELEKWIQSLASVIQGYAKKNHVPVRPLEEPRLEE
jgi:hexosaminidase